MKKVIQNSCNYNSYEFSLGSLQIEKHCFNLYQNYSEQLAELKAIYNLHYGA